MPHCHYGINQPICLKFCILTNQDPKFNGSYIVAARSKDKKTEKTKTDDQSETAFKTDIAEPYANIRDELKKIKVLNPDFTI